jgi:tRNA 2-thiouridine synthesizing protein A
MHIHLELDTCGLNCPLPILKTKKALSGMQSGEILRVRSTDQGATRDFQAFAKQTGHVLIEQSVNGQEFIFVLQRK